MLGRATIQPKLESDPEYEGFKLHERESENIVKSLPGTPVYVEHDGKHKVGKIISAFKSDEGIDVVFKTNSESLHNAAVNNMLKRGILRDVSMGVRAFKKYDQDGVPYLAYKEISEVSLVEKGDIDGSKIHWSMDEEKSYIGEDTKSRESHQTETMSQDNGKYMAEKIEALTKKLAEAEAEREAERERVKKVEEERQRIIEERQKDVEVINRLQAASRAERMKLINDKGGVLEFLNECVGMMDDEAERQNASIAVKNFAENLAANDSANTLVSALASGTRRFRARFSDVEKQFQEERKRTSETVDGVKKENEELKKREQELIQRIRKLEGDSFMNPSDRYIAQPSSSSSAAPSTMPGTECFAAASNSFKVYESSDLLDEQLGGHVPRAEQYFSDPKIGSIINRALSKPYVWVPPSDSNPSKRPRDEMYNGFY